MSSSLPAKTPSQFSGDKKVRVGDWIPIVESFLLIKGGDAKAQLAFVENLLIGDAEYWYSKVNKTKFESAEKLLAALEVKFKAKSSAFAERKRLDEIPFKGLLTFLNDFMSVAAYVEALNPEEVGYFLFRRLQGKYARAVEAKLEAGETDLLVIVAAVRTLAEAAQDDAAVKAKAEGKPADKGKGKEKAGSSKVVCDHCHKPGHTKSQCYSLRPDLIPSKSSYLSSVSSSSSSPSPLSAGTLWYLPLSITGTSFEALVDSGATGSFVSSSLVKRLKLKVRQSKAIIRWVEGSSCESLGTATLSFSLLEKTHSVDCAVLDMSYDCVLGASWLSSQNVSTDWGTGALRFKGNLGEVRLVKKKGQRVYSIRCEY